MEYPRTPERNSASIDEAGDVATQLKSPRFKLSHQSTPSSMEKTKKRSLIGSFSSRSSNLTRNSRYYDQLLSGSPMLEAMDFSMTATLEEEQGEEEEWRRDDVDVTVITTDGCIEDSMICNKQISEITLPSQESITNQTSGGSKNSKNSKNSIQKRRDIVSVVNKRLNKKVDPEFFEENPLEKVPRFARNELSLGDRLGEGQFGTVYEVDALERQAPVGIPTCLDNYEDTTGSTPNTPNKNRRAQLTAANSSLTIAAATDLLVSQGSLDDFLRRRIGDIKDQDNDRITPPVLEKDVDLTHPSHVSGRRRPALKLKDRKGIMITKQNNAENVDSFDGYAVKLVRSDIVNERKKHVAVADMAAEARILSALSHPNVMSIRGIMGYMERPGSYGIIMDKLRSTLQDQIHEWAKVTTEHDVPRAAPEIHPILAHAPEWLLAKREKEKKKNLFRQTEFFVERMEAVQQISEAFKYLHSKNIIYRDLKPENVGLTTERYVMFDFGLARELRESDRVSDKKEDEDRYHATGLTGSRLFMAPEVALKKPYGFSADVFSFAILFWEVVSLTEVFPTLNLQKHYKQVICKGKRPASLEDILPTELHEMVENSWDKDPSKRPTFESISEILANEIERYGNGSMSNLNCSNSNVISDNNELSALEFMKLDGYDNYTSTRDVLATEEKSESPRTLADTLGITKLETAFSEASKRILNPLHLSRSRSTSPKPS